MKSRRILYGILACAALAGLCSCSEQTRDVPDSVTVTGLDRTSLSFAYEDGTPVSFKVLSNKGWSIVTEGLDWLTLSSTRGPADVEASVTLTPSDNDGAARSGSLTLYTGALSRTVRISQEGYPVTPSITVDGLGNIGSDGLVFEASESTPKFFLIQSNVAWSAVTSGLSWASVSPLEGGAGETAITVSVAANRGSERSGTITFVGDGMDEGVTVEVVQRERPKLGDQLLASWRALNVTDPATQAAWRTSASSIAVESGYVHADKGNTDATMSFHLDPANTGLSYSISSGQYNTDFSADGLSEYTLRKVFTNDYVEFVVPVDYLGVGDRVAIRFGMYTTANNRFWYVEYLDGDEWKYTSTATFTSAGGKSVTATFDIGKARVTKAVEETAVLSNAIEDGELHLRIRAVDAHYATNKDTNTVPNGTLRLRATAATDEAIEIWYLD